MAFQYSPKITADGLSTYLDTFNRYSYSGTGINWYDHGRRGASGSLTSGFAYDSASKSFYNALGTGSAASWIGMTPTRSYADQAQYSLEFVVKLRPNAENSWHSLCGNGGTNPWVGILGNTANTWRIFFREATTAAYSFSSYIGYDLSSKWGTICLTLSSDRTVSFYLNGSLISATSSINTSLNISRLAGGYSSSPNFYPFQGYFSVYRAYDKTLSADEVLRNHQSLAPRFGI